MEPNLILSLPLLPVSCGLPGGGLALFRESDAESDVAEATFGFWLVRILRIRYSSPFVAALGSPTSLAVRSVKRVFALLLRANFAKSSAADTSSTKLSDKGVNSPSSPFRHNDATIVIAPTSAPVAPLISSNR